MQHLWRSIRAAATLVVVAVPYALADPAVAGFIERHKAIASTYPIATAIAYALYRAYRNRKASRVDDVPSSGSETMGAAG